MDTPTADIFIIDDDEAVRDSLSSLLDAQGYTAHAFASAEEFLQAKQEGLSGCAIVDIQMPGMSGLELQAELNRRHVALSLIFLTSYGDVTKAVTALRAGAVNFIEKPFAVAELFQAVEEAVSRSRPSCRSDQAFDENLAHLTRREREVMDLMVDGAANKVVAGRLGISVRTAETHRAKVLEKMQCSSLPALIHAVLRHNVPH